MAIDSGGDGYIVGSRDALVECANLPTTKDIERVRSGCDSEGFIAIDVSRVDLRWIDRCEGIAMMSQYIDDVSDIGIPCVHGR